MARISTRFIVIAKKPLQRRLKLALQPGRTQYRFVTSRTEAIRLGRAWGKDIVVAAYTRTRSGKILFTGLAIL